MFDVIWNHATTPQLGSGRQDERVDLACYPPSSHHCFQFTESYPTMSSREVTLAVSAFLDSDTHGTLSSEEKAAARHTVTAFVSASYEGLGKAPKLLDGHDAHQILGHELPGHFERKDPRAVQVPAILRAYLDFLEQTEVVPEAFELRRGFEATLDEFSETVRTGRAAHHAHQEPQKPVVYGAPKLGRNDPCSCGSGKKYKKCHGKGSGSA